MEDVRCVEQTRCFVVDPAAGRQDSWMQAGRCGSLVVVSHTEVVCSCLQALQVHGVGAEELGVDLVSYLCGKFPP